MTKRKWLTLLLLSPIILTPAGGNCMGERQSAPPALEETPVPKPPKIVFDETEFNFGEAKGLRKVEHVFTFRNEGEGDLVIERVKTTCGCTAALLSAKVIPPAGSGEIKSTFTFGARQGKQLKHIYVYSNDPDVPRARLTISGVIIPPVSIEPRSVHFPDAKAGPSKNIQITQTMDEELVLKEPTTRLGLVDAMLTEGPVKEGKKSYNLEVRVKPDLQPGRYFERVTIETNCAAAPKITIPVRITVRGDIEVMPKRINFGALTGGKEVTRKIRLSNRKREPFKIEKIEIDNPEFSADLKTPTESKPTHEVTLRFTPAKKSGTVRAKIVFHTDYEPQTKVEANAYGYIRKVRHKPRPTVSPSLPESPKK